MPDINYKFSIRPGGCLKEGQISAIRDVLASIDEPSFISDIEGCGPTLALEMAVSEIAGVRYVVGTSSCTAAIHAALLAADVCPGDEVIVSPYSWPQSISPILYTGATPVFADIDERSFNMDARSVQARISNRTKAIIVVHMFGHMAEMKTLQAIANCEGITLISDAAHAITSSLAGRPAGAWGDIVCYSFGRGKLICGGEGGALVTQREDIYEKVVHLTQHEERAKRMMPKSRRKASFSLNYRIHPLGAVLALADMKSMAEKRKHREHVIEQFMVGLGMNDILISQGRLKSEESEPYGIPLTYSGNGNREDLVTVAQEHGIPLRCGPVQIPLHLRLADYIGPKTSHHDTHEPGSCPVAEDRCEHRELLVLSALDMDHISAEESKTLGQSLQKILLKH